MPEILFRVDQGKGVRKIIRMMRGDSRTHAIRFVIPRYYRGVDLAPLAWYVRYVDAAGEPDVALPSAMYEVTDNELRVRWEVSVSVTEAVGTTRFELRGVSKDMALTFGQGEIEVLDTLDFVLPEEQAEKLNELDNLIIFAEQGLDGLAAQIRRKANALKGTEFGSVLVLNPEEGSEIQVFTEAATVTRCGKNLLRLMNPGRYGVGGMTAVIQPDGSIVLEGTSDMMGDETDGLAIVPHGTMLPADIYTLSGCEFGGEQVFGLELRITHPDNTIESIFDYGGGVTFTLGEGDTYSVRLIVGAMAASGAVFYPQIEYGDVYTGFEPYVGESFAVKDGSVFIPALEGSNLVYTLDGSFMEVRYLKSLAALIDTIISQVGRKLDRVWPEPMSNRLMYINEDNVIAPLGLGPGLSIRYDKLFAAVVQTTDKSLSKAGEAADAKAVGDALKVVSEGGITDADALAVLLECNALPTLIDKNGAILTDKSGTILLG